MFTNPLQTGGGIQDAINRLMAQVDTNQDGAISTQEFTSFLTSLLSPRTSTDGTTGTAGQAPNTTGSSATAGTPPTPASGPTRRTLAPRANLRFEGFDLNRPQDPLTSAKDAFAQSAAASGTMPTTKAGAEQWFEQNIRASMEAQGHAINWVRGDKFQFTNWQGTYVVDFLRGADGPSPAFSWQTSVSSAGPVLTNGNTPGTTLTPLDPNLSLQATFDRLARASGVVPRTKQEAESWFNQHIRSGLESRGIAINWVIGDKFEYAGPSGPVVIDFIVGADGPNPELGWLVE